jgi:hypothetical protein
MVVGFDDNIKITSDNFNVTVTQSFRLESGTRPKIDLLVVVAAISGLFGISPKINPAYQY